MSTYQVRDASPFSHFTMIPHLVDDMELSPHAVRLYLHLKRVAGENGECYQSTATLSKACRMSSGMISKAKKELMTTMPTLIAVALTNNPHGGMEHHEITILNVWGENRKQYTSSQYEQQVHNMNVTSSHDELASSQYETKNTPVKNTPLKKIEEVPPKFETSDFLELWEEFKKNRISIKKPLTDISIKRLFIKLDRYPYETALQALEKAVEGGYQGVFPESIKLIGYTNGKPAPPRPPQLTEAELEVKRQQVRDAVAKKNAGVRVHDPEDVEF